MKVTEILSNEHKNVLKSVELLERECKKLEDGKSIDKDFWGKIIDFVKNYNDKFHHAKEEDILFKEFNKAAEEGCVHCNPVEQMLYEHNQGRNFVKGMEQAIKNNDKEKLIENARGYCQLLQEHIFKEDNVLYPMVDEVLNDDIKKEILEKFKQTEREKKKDKNNALNFIKN